MRIPPQSRRVSNQETSIWLERSIHSFEQLKRIFLIIMPLERGVRGEPERKLYPHPDRLEYGHGSKCALLIPCRFNIHTRRSAPHLCIRRTFCASTVVQAKPLPAAPARGIRRWHCAPLRPPYNKSFNCFLDSRKRFLAKFPHHTRNLLTKIDTPCTKINNPKAT